MYEFYPLGYNAMSPAENQLFQWHISPPSSGSSKQETSMNPVANKTLLETSIKQVAPASHWSLACLILRPWGRKRHVHPKHWMTFNVLQKLNSSLPPLHEPQILRHIFYFARCNCSIYYIHRYSRFDGQLWVFKPHKNYSCLKEEIYMTCLVKKSKVILLSMHLILHGNCISTS